MNPTTTRPSRSASFAIAAPLGRSLAAVLATTVAVLAGTGWLYLLRHSPELAHGPKIAGALPLQQLAAEDGQPLVRVLVAWIPVGLANGLALSRLTSLSRPARLTIAGVVAFLLILIAGAESDAVAVNRTFGTFFSDQFHRAGLWLPTLIIATTAALPGRLGRRRGLAGFGSRPGR